jgi:predicted DNA-binding mobile mystery protein A
MNVKALAQRQYQRIADNAAGLFNSPRPPEGWIRTVRKALGMSGAQLAERMGVTRARIAQAEQAELSGGLTLKSMQAAAEAMGCRFVYAVVPEKHIEDVIATQARKKAATLVAIASTHMALENQVLPESKIPEEIDRLTRELAQQMPSDFWNNE